MNKRLIKKRVPSKVVKNESVKTESPKMSSVFLSKGDLSDVSDETASDDDEGFQQFMKQAEKAKNVSQKPIQNVKKVQVKSTIAPKPATTAPKSMFLSADDLSDVSGDTASDDSDAYNEYMSDKKVVKPIVQKSITQKATIISPQNEKVVQPTPIIKKKKSVSIQSTPQIKLFSNATSTISSIQTPSPDQLLTKPLKSSLKKTPSPQSIQVQVSTTTTPDVQKKTKKLSVFDDDDDEEEEQEEKVSLQKKNQVKLSQTSASVPKKRKIVRSVFDDDDDDEEEEKEQSEEEEEELDSDLEVVEKPKKALQKKQLTKQKPTTTITKHDTQKSNKKIKTTDNSNSDMSINISVNPSQDLQKEKPTKRLAARESLPKALLISDTILETEKAKEKNRPVMRPLRSDLVATMKDALLTSIILSIPKEVPSSISKLHYTFSEYSGVAPSDITSTSTSASSSRVASILSSIVGSVALAPSAPLSLPVLLRELDRFSFTSDLYKYFKAKTDSYLKTNSFNFFENWFIQARLNAMLLKPLSKELQISKRHKNYLSGYTAYPTYLTLKTRELEDPLLPTGTAIENDTYLISQLVDNGCNTTDASKICSSINRRIISNLPTILSTTRYGQFNGDCFAKEVWASEPSHEEKTFSPFAWSIANKSIRITCGSHVFDLTIPNFAKLLWLYHDTQNKIINSEFTCSESYVNRDSTFSLHRIISTLPETSTLRQLISQQIREKRQTDTNYDDLFHSKYAQAKDSKSGRTIYTGNSNNSASSKMKFDPKAVTSVMNHDVLLQFPRTFIQHVTATVLRYNSLQGGSIKGGGHQAALPYEVFQVLENEFSVSAECFASPFNTRFNSYCSAFADTDAVFGSLGSFFTFFPTSGSYEVNPPYDDNVMTLCCQHIEQLLQNPNAQDLSFIIIIPRNENYIGWKMTVSSQFKRAHLLLSSRKHAFYTGIQQSKKIRHMYHVARHDTSVVILQNDMGAEKYPVTRQNIMRLRAAFYSPFREIPEPDEQRYLYKIQEEKEKALKLKQEQEREEAEKRQKEEDEQKKEHLEEDDDIDMEDMEDMEGMDEMEDMDMEDMDMEDMEDMDDEE